MWRRAVAGSAPQLAPQLCRAFVLPLGAARRYRRAAFVTTRTGQVLGGRYEITDVIGRGGQSTVYRAKDLVDGDEVAIKLVHGAAGDPDATERIFREAQSMSQLIGTSAVRILHQVWTDEGALGLVM